MKARISQLHMTEAAWLKHSSLVPEAGELVIYDPDNTHPYAFFHYLNPARYSAPWIGSALVAERA